MVKEAFKDDAGKARVDLIPPHVLLEVGEVLRFGAAKYGDENWRRGMHWGCLYGSAFRHMLKWWYGKTFDKESGKPHLAHAIARLMMLHACEMEEIGEDDRHKGGTQLGARFFRVAADGERREGGDAGKSGDKAQTRGKPRGGG